MSKYHWSSRSGRSGKYLGVLYKKLVDDNGKVHALISAVASGNRAVLRIVDPPAVHKWTCQDLGSAEKDVKEWFGLN